MAEELSSERARSKLDTEELATHLWFGKGQLERKRQVEQLVFSDPVFKRDNYYFLNNEDKFSEEVKKSLHAIKFAHDNDFTMLDNHLLMRATGFGNPLSLNTSMFIPTIEGQANEEQKEKWLPLAKKFKIIGCYAQTELGHGTYVRGMETTCTYDPKKEEWDLNTPTLTATKWWPGSMGVNSNYAIVIARLITGGVDYGTHPFMVQIRSLKDHRPLKGISVGDIGPKFGYEYMDNGYLKFDHVRIPRENLLMKFVFVAKDGTYSRKLSPKVSYVTMVYIRAALARFTFDMLSRAVTIAVRYSVVRRQTQNKPGQPETQLLDYVNQQYKLLPLLATCYALNFTSNYIFRFYMQTQNQIAEENLEQLPELHATASGIKSLATTVASEGIEACRIACGGHGYSMSSGIPSLYMDCVPSITYEGDNTILYLQTARYLIKLYNEHTGKILPQNVEYLHRNFTPTAINSDFFDSNNHLAIYQCTALKCVEMAALKVMEGEEFSIDEFDMRNRAALELIQAAKIHSYYTILRIFIDHLGSIRSDITGENYRMLKLLCNLFALHFILENPGPFLESNALSPQQLNVVRNSVQFLLKEIRPEAVPLVDAFDHHDIILASALGRKDGKVYEALWDWVKMNPKNKHKHNVHPVYNKYLKKIIKSKL